MLQLKNRVREKDWFFYYFNFERNYDVLKSGFMLFVEQKYKFLQKRNAMENPKHGFRDETCASNHKNRELKKLMSWSSRKSKEDIFCTVDFVRMIFFNITFVFHLSVLNKFSEEILAYIKKHSIHIFLLVFKIIESLCILRYQNFLLAFRSYEYTTC